jgi:ParB-like chromosome segregation protein Spo0J
MMLGERRAGDRNSILRKYAVAGQKKSIEGALDERSGARQIEMMPIERLKKPTRNARTHSKSQIEQIANSMRRYGVINPAIVDGSDRVVAGNGRVEAAKLLGRKAFPVIRVTSLSEGELRAYALADNRLPEKAGWDRGILAIEI